MWKPEKNPRSSVADQQEELVSSMDYDNSNDVGVFARATNTATTLNDLRDQGGFGVIVAASDMKQPPATNAPSIGTRFTTELDSISRRERQVREVQELATHRVIDLTTEQLRRILEFMV